MSTSAQINLRCLAIALFAGVSINALSLPLAQARESAFSLESKDSRRSVLVAESISQKDIETAKLLYNRARSLAKAGEYQRAITDYTEVIRLVPTYDKPYVNRGNLRDQLGDPQGALSDYEAALRLNPDNAYAYYNRAVTLAGLKKHQEAIEDYSQTIRLKPDFISAYKNRGLNWLKLKNQSNAVSDFSAASKLYKEAGDQKGYQQMQQILKALKQ